VKSADGFTGPGKGHHSDDERRVRRAAIPVHCAACGGEFPGTTELHNGICDECHKLTHGPNYRLIARLQGQEREVARLTTANAEDRAARKAEVERLREAIGKHCDQAITDEREQNEIDERLWSVLDG
jgi:hypothetical protein